MSIKKILVPTDFSEVAKSALKVAMTIAGKANAEIHLLNVVHVPVIDPYTPAETINTIKEEEEKSAQQELAKLALEIGGETPKIHVKLGFAVDEIVTFAEENNVDLIIMGTTGASGVEETLLGSNASGVVGQSKIPVMCIPDEMKDFGTQDIVYASDLEQNDLAVINKLLDVAKLFDSNFHILHVRNNDLPINDVEPEEVFKSIMANANYKAMSFHEVKNEDTMAGINEFIEKMPCNILAMAIHHRSFFSKLFHRSLTKHMVNHAHIPVLTYFK
jgi:nucleotide-binding universal stress UspA family protein